MEFWKTPSGHVLVDELGQPIYCDDCPCEPCDGPTPLSTASCVDFVQGAACMYAVLEIEFRDQEGGCELSVFDGTYVLPPQGLTPGFIVANFWSDNDKAFLQIACGGGLGVFFNFFFDFDNCPFDTPSHVQVGDGFFNTANFPLPPTLYNGRTVTLVAPGDANAYILSATVTFYGIPCGVDHPCTAPPVVDFNFDNIDEDGGIDPCQDPPVPADLNTGCTFIVTPTVTPGDCPIVACFWSVNGIDGCNSGTVVISEECGYHEQDVTLIAIDTRGCVGAVTTNMSCCNCCDPIGTATLEADVPVDGVGNPHIYGGVDSCGTLLNVIEWVKIVLGDIETTDCDPLLDNAGFFLIDFDGAIARDASPLDGGTPLVNGCFEPLTEIRIKHNAGANGTQHCIAVTPYDSLGCQGATQYIPIPYAYSKEPGQPDPTPCPWVEFDCEGWP